MAATVNEKHGCESALLFWAGMTVLLRKGYVQGHHFTVQRSFMNAQFPGRGGTVVVVSFQGTKDGLLFRDT